MLSLIGLVIVGAVAGYIATRVMNIEAGVVPTIAVGILGALVGGIILRVVLGIFSSFLGALFGALLLLFAYQVFIKGKSRT